MNYSDALQKAKSERRDHRKAKSVATSVERRKRVRNSKDFITVEREHDPLGRFGGSLKSVYYDSDGDGYKDSYGRSYRSGVANKPGVIIPSFGLIVAPISGPSGTTPELLAPSSGPSGTTPEILAPSSGPSGTTPQILVPADGPSGTTLELLAPANGPSGLNTSSSAPANGPSGTTPELLAPSNGPSDLTPSLAAPANGPSGTTPEILAPANGPSGLSGIKATLNINIEASQDTIVAKSPDAGTIEYASDSGYLFIYDGSDWHRTNGA